MTSNHAQIFQASVAYKTLLYSLQDKHRLLWTNDNIWKFCCHNYLQRGYDHGDIYLPPSKPNRKLNEASILMKADSEKLK